MNLKIPFVCKSFTHERLFYNSNSIMSNRWCYSTYLKLKYLETNEIQEFVEK
jgi:hypothetical protein